MPSGRFRAVGLHNALFVGVEAGRTSSMTLRNGIPLAHSLQSPTFFSMTTEHLTKLKIISTGFIDLKLNSEKRIAASASLGKNELWSSENLYRQLLMLETLIPRTVR